MGPLTQDARPPATREGRPNLASPFVIVEGLRHPVDARQRIRAINAFVKRLSRGEAFQPTWNAAGGAAGIAELMADFSVNEVYRLCRQLGRTASASNARMERRDGLGELVTILASGETDPRPLRDYYQFIVPACHESVIHSWDTQATGWTHMQRRWMILSHRQVCEDMFLRDMFSKDEQSVGSMGLLSQHQLLFRGNTPFCERVLAKLESLDSNEICFPQDFVPGFVLPLLRRLANPRSSGSPDDLHKCLDLVVRCCQKHARHVSKRLSLDDPNGLIRFVAQLWIDNTGKDEERLRKCLERLYETVGPVPDLSPSRLHSLIQALRHHNASSRYELLCILLQYLVAGDSTPVDDWPAQSGKFESLELNKSRARLWSADLFLSLPPDKSLALFLRLKQLHHGQSFIQPSPESNKTILSQEQTLNARTTDLEIMETVLRMRTQPEDKTWLKSALAAIQTRTRAAIESREAAERGFWIKSAINLCVAARELEMLAESLRLARRFTRDPHASPRAWGWDYLTTKEFLQLLVIVPEIPESSRNMKQLLDELRLSPEDMRLAHNVVLTLLQTALAAVGGPGFKEDKWTLVIGLPALIAQRRSLGVQALKKRAAESPYVANNVEQRIDAIVSEAIWKPTIKQLLEIESLMSTPAAPKAWVSKWQASNSPLEVLMQGLPVKSPALLAEMTRYCLENIQALLPPALARTHMSSIAKMTTKLARSSQPSLALPFIHKIIQDGDYSVDHRQLLTHNLLSSLPADTAREFLQTIVTTMTNKMARQNTNGEEGFDTGELKNKRRQVLDGAGHDVSNPSTPLIKVATIKMMAQLLNGTVAVDTSTSCEMLVSLLKEARHIDARTEIVRSLIGTLETRTAKAALRAMVLDILDVHVLPIASQLHERKPISEADWQREGELMPEVSAINPIFDLLLEGLKRKMLQPVDHSRLAALVMKALEQSAQTNKRWMSVFVEKNGFGRDMFQELTAAPAHLSQLVSTFSQEFDEMPHSLFKMLKAVILTNISPPASLLRVTQSIKADNSLRASNAGQHWLRQYDNPGSAAYTLGLKQALQLLSDIPSKEAAESEKALTLRNLILAAADRCIDGGDPETVHFLVDKIVENPSNRSHATREGNANRRFIVDEIIFRVEQAHDSGVATLRLPDMFLLQLALLRLNTWDIDLRAQESRELTVRTFARHLFDLVEMLVKRSPQPYHTDFSLLKRQYTTYAKTLPHSARIALALGGLHDVELVREGAEGTKPSLAAYLCLELAAEGLLSSVIDPKDAGLIESIQLLLRSWNESSDVVVKRTGLRVTKALPEALGRSNG